jgi:hypothetical protein
MPLCPVQFICRIFHQDARVVPPSASPLPRARCLPRLDHRRSVCQHPYSRITHSSSAAGTIIVLLSLANIVTAMAPGLLLPPQDADGGSDGTEDTLFQLFVFVGVMGTGLLFDAGHVLWRRCTRSGCHPAAACRPVLTRAQAPPPMARWRSRCCTALMLMLMLMLTAAKSARHI